MSGTVSAGHGIISFEALKLNARGQRIRKETVSVPKKFPADGKLDRRFDASKALFSYPELHEYPEEQLRDLVKRLEMRYIKQYGRPVRESGQQVITEGIRGQTLDEEISELRETLKYAAIAGERLDGKE